MKYCVVISEIGEDEAGTVAGPFDTEQEANEFVRSIDDLLLDQLCKVIPLEQPDDVFEQLGEIGNDER